MGKKGSQLTEEHKRKISEAHKGMIHSEDTLKKLKLRPRTAEHHKKIADALRGRKLPEEQKKKISEALKGTRNHFYGKTHSEKTRVKISLSGIGRKQTKETVQKRIDKTSKENHWNWKGGITPIHIKIRNCLEYKLWRTAVFSRDNYVCVWCGDDQGGNLEADHIKPFALFPELRFAIDNGRTLCKPCHKTTNTYGNKKIVCQ